MSARARKRGDTTSTYGWSLTRIIGDIVMNGHLHRTPGYAHATAGSLFAGAKRKDMKKLLKLLLIVGIGVAVFRAMNIEVEAE